MFAFSNLFLNGFYYSYYFQLEYLLKNILLSLRTSNLENYNKYIIVYRSKFITIFSLVVQPGRTAASEVVNLRSNRSEGAMLKRNLIKIS